jgi:hypothetical protein
MGSVNKKLPADWAGSACKEAKRGGDNAELDAVALLQEFAAFTGRVHTKDDDHGQKNNGRQNSFHNTLHFYVDIIPPLF